MKNIRIQIDFECNAEQFWENVQSDLDRTPEKQEICQFLLSPKLDTGVTVSKEFAVKVADYCRNTPGWHLPEYPEHANHPICFIEE